jgi:predicted P-loop ATPase
MSNFSDGGSPGHYEDDPNRPRWDKDTVAYGSHDYEHEDGRYGFTIQRGLNPGDDRKRVRTIRRCELSAGDCLEEEDREAFKRGHYSGKGDDTPPLYRLPQLVAATKDRGPKNTPRVEIFEGEADADIAAQLGFAATTNPFGALAWNPEFNRYFAGCDVAIHIDSDDRGRQRAWLLIKELKGVAKKITVVEYAPHKDFEQWAKAERADAAAFMARRSRALTAQQWMAFEKRMGRDHSRTNRKEVGQDKIIAALDELGVKLSFDRFANRGLIEADMFGGKIKIDDASIVRLWLEIESRHGFRPGKDYFWCFVLDQARQNSFHPVLDYLSGLTWDGQPRLDAWLIDYAQAEDSKYTRAVSSLPLIAAVRRVRQPGCKFDEMLVLEAPQGYNRSSALNALAVRDEWFTDDVPLNSKSKEVIEQLSGKWIAESCELKGMRRGEVEQIKAMLSRRIDTARLSYDRVQTEYPRQSIFIGTTNSAEYLRDMTGDRRFWPLAVGRFDLDKLKANRDQLWAEAAHREARGESIRLPKELWEAAGEQQEQRRIDDPFTDVIAEKLAGQPYHIKIKCRDVWELLGIAEDRRTQDHNLRLGASMQSLGFKRGKQRIAGELVNAYYRGDHSERRKEIVIAKTAVDDLSTNARFTVKAVDEAAP